MLKRFVAPAAPCKLLGAIKERPLNSRTILQSKDDSICLFIHVGETEARQPTYHKNAVPI